MRLPSGTITFLFTDIQGSTQLWERHPTEMQVSLARHDALLRRAVEAHDGVVFKTVGDAFCAAFEAAPAALAAACDAQIFLLSEDWPEQTPISVRVAIHTGTAEIRGDDYYGPTLNRIARLLSIGHGGQTLLSRTAFDLIRDSVPDAIEIVDMGEHRLKDLARPEHVFQALIPGHPNEFPKLRSLSNPDFPNNLPQEVTSFVGRESEIERVRGLLASHRLLTLTGTGGVGKTRLSIHVAAELLDSFFDGVWLVEFGSIREAGNVEQAVASVLGVREEAGAPLLKTLVDSQKDKRLLLIFDNCEHVLDATARVADAILRGCPGVKLIATSREALNIVGEQTYRVPSLSLPDLRKKVTPDSLSAYESVQLFIERASQAKADFAVTAQNAPAIAGVCARLDGIPLALELAAVRVRSMSVEEINSRMDGMFRLLTGGSRAALPRQQTLRAAIDWSYDLLDARERLLLRRLAVFSGGWPLEAAEALFEPGEEIEPWEVVDLHAALCDRSLVAMESRQECDRYRLLEAVRQYAVEKLEEAGEAELSRRRLRDHFLELVDRAAPALTQPDAASWLARLETEHDNLRTAIRWSLDHEEGGEEALRLTAGLYRFWLYYGHWAEGREMLERALERPSAVISEQRVDAMHAACWLAQLHGELDTAERWCEAADSGARELGDVPRLAASTNARGSIAQERCDYATARRFFEEALALNRTLPDGGRSYANLGNLTNTAFSQGDYDAAVRYGTEALAMGAQKGGEARAFTLIRMGQCHCALLDPIGATSYFRQALDLCRERGLRTREAEVLAEMGMLAVDEGQYEAAAEKFKTAEELSKELGYSALERIARTGLGTAYALDGRTDEARHLLASGLAGAEHSEDTLDLVNMMLAVSVLPADSIDDGSRLRLLGAAMRIRSSHPEALHPHERARHQRCSSGPTERLGNGRFQSVWDEGYGMSRTHAIQMARQFLGGAS